MLSIWRDLERNKTFVTDGLRKIEVDPLIVSAFQDEYESTARLYEAKLRMLELKNFNLQELIRDMWHLIDGGGLTTGAYGPCMEFLARMRKQGIEVKFDETT